MLQTIAHRIAFHALVALALACSPAARAKLVLMHGYADVTSALVWIQAEAPGLVHVAWTPEGAPERSITLEATAANEHIVVARLTGLSPGVSAHYRVIGDGDTREGAVRAQPVISAAKSAPEITIAIGSCFFLGDTRPPFARRPGYEGGFEIFDAIAAKKPDLMLWLGDNLYFQRPDFYDPSAMAARHRRQRASEPLARLLTATSHIAIWDDHDFGPNNADGSYVMKGEALRLFKLYWANASFGLPEVPGVFGYVPYADVDLVLLDGRYHRSHASLPDGPDKTMFGAAQFEWLKNTLLNLRAPVKLVATGSQFWNAASRFDGLYEFPREQRALSEFLLAQRIDGLVFISGDRHFGELLKVERPGAYPLYEFTSSPLTANPWENPEANERNNPQVVPGTLVGKRQFGLVRISGPGNDRRIVLESYDQAGTLLWRQELRARELRFPR